MKEQLRFPTLRKRSKMGSLGMSQNQNEIASGFSVDFPVDFFLYLIRPQFCQIKLSKYPKSVRHFLNAQQENQYDYQDYFNFYGDDATEGGEVDESNFPSGVGIDALPRDIYCDLANTLQKHCAGT